jgi:hypothetical protein
MTVFFEMEMPNCCDDCLFAYFAEGAYTDTCKFPDSKVTDDDVSNHYVRGIPDKCPLKKFNKECENA